MSPEYVTTMVDYKKLIVCESSIIAMLQKRTDLCLAQLRGLKRMTPEYDENSVYDVIVFKKDSRVHAAGVVYLQSHCLTLLSADAYNDRDALSALCSLTQAEVGKNF